MSSLTKKGVTYNFSRLLGENITVELVRSHIGCTKKQRANIKGLGLKGIGSKVEIVVTQSFIGMLYKIGHMINIKT